MKTLFFEGFSKGDKELTPCAVDLRLIPFRVDFLVPVYPLIYPQSPYILSR